LVDNAGRDSPAVADREALGFGPRPDVAAALTARCGPRWPAPLTWPSLTGVLDEGCEFLTERPGVLLIQIDLVLRAAEPEPHRLTGRASVKIIF